MGGWDGVNLRARTGVAKASGFGVQGFWGFEGVWGGFGGGLGSLWSFPRTPHPPKCLTELLHGFLEAQAAGLLRDASFGGFRV